MTKSEAYSQLLDKVQCEGGFVSIESKARPSVHLRDKIQCEGGFLSIEPKARPSVHLKDEETNGCATVAAIFEMADDSSPLHLIDTNFQAWDVYDYLDAENIERILSCL